MIPSMRDDLELVEAWRAGDRQAGGELFDRHFSSIRRFFRSKVGDDYEELVQRTFTRCVEGQARFRGEGKFRSYLFSIAANVLREHIRAHQRAHERFDPDVSSVVDLALPGPATAAGVRREQKVLLEALRRLPVNDQIVLELFYWEEQAPSDPNPATRRAFGSKYTGSLGVLRWLPVLPIAPACAP